MKILDLLGLTELVDLCKQTFAKIIHTHKLEDITDYTVDSALSATSTNPVQNKTVNQALVAFSTDMDNVESNINALSDQLTDHENNANLHVSTTEQTHWDAAYTHSQTVHVKVADSVTSTSTTTAATSKNVKQAYDLANTAKTNAATAQTTADSKVSSVSLTSGTNNGTLKLTVDGTSTDNIPVKGLGSAAYTASSAYATSGHTHKYAGSSSAGGSANSANKLVTARTINGVDFDGTANIEITANPTSTTLKNHDLNEILTVGFYNAGGGNTCVNKPAYIDAFGMIVFKNASGYICQMLVGGNNSSNIMYIRTYTSGAWSNWVKQYSEVSKPTPSEIGAANSIHTHTAEDVGADASGAAAAVQSNLNTLNDEFDDHVSNTDIHFTADERTKLAGIATDANKYTHPKSGVTAGTYKSVTVDTNGHVTGGTNPTTLAGFGITDAEAKGTVNTHNSSSSAHNDIRLLISDVSTKLNNFLNVDDTTKDQLSELIALIEENADDIESITSGKVNVSDIINNLTTNVTNKPLSANQGVALKALIDALQAEVDSKADETHGHAIADVSGLQSALDGKANSSHGTHVSFDATNNPKMDGTAAFGTSTKVARADHVHPTDTSRAAKSDLDALITTVAGKADTGHKHAISDVTNLQSSLDAKQATITGGASSIASSNLTASRALVSDANGKVAVSAVTSTELGYLDGVTSAIQPQLDSKAASGHGHDAATTSSAGFMTAAMVTKLNGIATGANKTTVDTALSSTSTNPVQNKVVASSINTLTSAVNVNTSSINSHTTSIASLQTAIDEITVITSEEISALFA